jgi:hypothetical protein
MHLLSATVKSSRFSLLIKSTAIEVTPAAVGDESQLKPLLEQQPVPVKELGADSKYGTCDNYAYLGTHHIMPSIPPWDPGSPVKENRFTTKQFKYNPDTNTYICPAGKALTNTSDTVRDSYLAYNAKKHDCNACQLRNSCISPRVACKRILRHHLQGFKDKALAYLQTEQARQTLRQRKTYAEWINAESKTRHGLRRAMFRGINKVAIQVLMTASVQNIKRLIAHFPKPTPFFKDILSSFRNFMLSFSQRSVLA